jgi:hypothetical protein
MPATRNSLLKRITINADVRFGKPCIRGHRITVKEIIEWLSGGAHSNKSWPIILSSNPMISWLCMRSPRISGGA